MKKIILLIICFFSLVGCIDNHKDSSVSKVNDKKFVLEKKDNSKDFLYFNVYKKVIGYDNNIYEVKYPIINIKSDEVDNVNLELKSFVVSSFKDFLIVDDIFLQGNIINYEYYITDNYISVIQNYHLYIDGMIGEERSNIYVISLKNGKVLNNKEILESFDLTEAKMFEILEKNIKSEDIAFTMMNIREDGYYLYVDNDSKLNIVYYEVFNDDSIRKKLVLN